MKAFLLPVMCLIALLASCVAPGPEPGAPETVVPVGTLPATDEVPPAAITVETMPTVAVAETAEPGRTAGDAIGEGTPAADETVQVVPTPYMPVSPENPDAQNELVEEHTIGQYTVRIWRNPEDQLGFDKVGTIQAVGQPPIEVPYATLGMLSGTDLTGNGYPDVVFETYTGGAHCCFGTYVYDLGPMLENVLALETNNCAGHFEDLNGDGVYEFLTCDDLFAYRYCSYAASPKVAVAMSYRPGEGYKPDSPNFPEIFAAEREAQLERAQTGAPGEMGEEDGSNKCSVLPLVLSYLYAGQAEEARSALEQYYSGTDAEGWWAEIREAVEASPLYTEP